MLNVFSQISHKKFINILKDLPGPKDLVVEHALFKPLEMFIDMKSLRYGWVRIINLIYSTLLIYVIFVGSMV